MPTETPDTPTPRRPPVTREAVFATADALTAEGQALTMAAIRDRLGGSFTTIGPLLKAWRQQQRQTTATPEIPETVLDAMRTATARLWDTANQFAHEQVAQVQTTAQAALTQAHSEAQEYATEIQRLEHQLEQAREATKTAIQAKERGFLDKAHLERENAALVARLTDKETALSTLEAKFDALQRELLALAHAKDTAQTPTTTETPQAGENTEKPTPQGTQKPTLKSPRPQKAPKRPRKPLKPKT